MKQQDTPTQAQSRSQSILGWSGFEFDKTPLQTVTPNLFYGLFLLLVVILLVLQLGDLNQQIFYSINQFCAHNFNSAVLAHITDIGNGSISVSIGFFVILRRPELFKRFLLTIIFTALLSALLKNGFALPRPPAVLDASSFNIVGKALSNYSFPSGHTMTIFALIGFYWLSFKTRATIWYLLLAAMVVGLSRIAIGAHWPQDVIAGAMLGLLSAWLAVRLSHHSWASIASYATALFICIAMVAGLASGKNEFSDYPSIILVRQAFMIIGAGLGVYSSFALALSMVSAVKNKRSEHAE